MNRRLLMTAMVLSMAVLLVTTYKAFAEEEEFTREQKIEFLKMGLIVNGGDTTRWGPVDLTRRGEPPPPPKIVQSVPIVPTPVARPAVKPAGADLCRRHGMRKVVSGSSWRCRK